MILFEKPTSKTKVRHGIFAYRYRNGNIYIQKEVYVMYSVKEAIKLWRQKNPIPA